MRAAIALLARHRAERLPMVLLALVVAATALVAAAAPRLFNRVADDGVRHEVRGAQSADRNLQLGQIGHLTGGSGLEPVARLGEQLEAELPASVRRLITASTYHAESANWSIASPPAGFPSWLRFRMADGVDGRITYVEGRSPTDRTATIPGQRGTLPGEPEDATVFEVALSTEIAATLGVGVGDRMELVPDTEDLLVGRFSSPVRAAADVVGLYVVDEPDDEFWMNDSALRLPTVVVISPNQQLLYGTALLSADAYPAVVAKGLPLRYAWRHFIDPARLDAGMLDELTAELRQMQTRYPPFVTSLHDAEVTTLQTGLLGLLDDFADERRTAEAVLVTASLGPAAVAVAAVTLVALLMVHRRRRPIALLRGRGASAAQLVGSHVVEALLVAVPASAIGYTMALALVPARDGGWSAAAAGLVVVGTTLALVATVARPASAAPRDVERESPGSSRLGPRRVAFETLTVVLAAGGAVLLRQRGLAGGGAAGDLAGVDPFLAATPVLIGLAVGLVTVRLYPFPLRFAAWFADSWRGLVPAFGLRRAARAGDAGSLPLVVLLITVAIGAFSSTVAVTIERGQAAAAWQAVGADLAVEPGARPFPSEFDPTSLPGVEAGAWMHVDSASLGGRGGMRVELHALDAPAYAEVVAGTPAARELPSAMTAEGAPDAPLPVIVSTTAAANAPRPIRAGDELELLVSSRPTMVRVVDVVGSLPGIDAGAAWLIVPLEPLRVAVGNRAFSPTVLFLRAPGVSAATMQAAMDDVLPGTTVTGRAEVLAQLASSPLVRGVGMGFVLALVVAVAYAALATTAALVLVAAVRSRETAHLRTLGMTPLGLLAVAIVEQGPAVLAATLVGVGLGVGVAWFVAPGLDLAGLIGSPIDVALAVDPRVVGLLLGALLAVLAVGIGVASWIGRRSGLAASTRQGIE